ncbi:MAG: hypothetical protein JXQ73_29705 [Phycisphaerae bacterium]|nr:hypothetical protein [Phycisphaerae bacterium]
MSLPRTTRGYIALVVALAAAFPSGWLCAGENLGGQPTTEGPRMTRSGGDAGVIEGLLLRDTMPNQSPTCCWREVEVAPAHLKVRPYSLPACRGDAFPTTELPIRATGEDHSILSRVCLLIL